MSATAAALSRTWQVGRYRATLTVPPVAKGVLHACIEWLPHTPGDLTPEELEAYRLGRDRAFRELGLSALVVEL
ncbi:hypothetical protein [Roseateles sp.]|uniref:hypothetical protein n=1 Tax=Roseateles sp. TaxID=1971397 RepID=UPI0039239FA7